jgi:hypothetical protein
VVALLQGQAGEERAAHGARGERQARADGDPQGDGLPAVDHVDIHNAEPVPDAEAAGQARLAGEALHHRVGDVAHAEIGQRREAEGEHSGIEAVGLARRVVLEIAQAGERVGQARDRGLGQARALRDLAIAEELRRIEGTQHLEAAGERRHEVAVAGLLVARRMRGRTGVVVGAAPQARPRIHGTSFPDRSSVFFANRCFGWT